MSEMYVPREVGKDGWRCVLVDSSAPEHLTASSRRKWEEMMQLYTLDCAAQIVLLTLCEGLDRRTQAREQIERDGVYIKDRFGVIKSHPGLAIERDATLMVQRAYRLLGFDQDPAGQMEMPFR